MQTVQERDELALELEQRGQAELAGFINDLSALPRQVQISKSKEDREIDAVENQWARLREQCEIEAAGGSVGDSPLLTEHERLRSERIEHEPPLEKVLAKKTQASAIAGPERQRVLRALSVVKRAQTAYALGEEPSTDLIEEFKAVLLEN